MPKYETSGSYQGIALQAWSVDRKPGMSSDNSWVEILTSDLKGIDLENQFRPWSSVGRAEPAGPANIYGLLKLIGTVGQTQPRGKPKGGVLQRGGPLILESKSSAGPGGAEEPNLVKLDPMFVSPSGIKELYHDLANAEDHAEGRVRVGLVDVRYWWDKYGTPMYGDYNLVNEYGSYDEAYLNKTTKKPLSLAELLQVLCFCLPGSPRLSTASVVFQKGGFNPPKNIRMRFELPSYWLYKVLEDYGLDIHLTAESNVYIARKADAHQVGYFSTVPGGTEKRIYQAANYEKKTIYSVDKPEGVLVAGGKRQRRATAQCAPAFVDVDGKIRLMEDLSTLWDGYTFTDAMLSRTLPANRAYTDVGGKDARVFARRRAIAEQYFFRYYVPRHMFKRTGKGAAEFVPISKSRHPMMPMLPPVWRVSEVEGICSVEPPATKPAADEDLVTTDFVVRASVVREEFTDNLEAFEKFTGDALKSLSDRKAALGARRNLAIQAEKELEDGRPKIQLNAVQKLLKADEFQVQAFREYLDATALGFLIIGRENLQKDADWNAQAAIVKQQIKDELSLVEEKLKAINTEEKKLKTALTEAVISVREAKFARMWVNVPYG